MFSNLFAQNLDSLEAKMSKIHLAIGQGETDDERIAASQKLEDFLLECFEYEPCFEHEFDEVYSMAAITSPDGAFRLFNWNIPNLDGTYSYVAYVLFPKGEFVKLEDNEPLDGKDLKEVYTSSNWYGALYYEIFPVKQKKQTVYTLMGWDGNNALTTRKVLDVMVIDKKNRISFGSPIFQTEDEQWVNRRVFEYSSEVQMTLRYLKPKDAIVFDILEPVSAGLKGQYAYYGPSMGHSGYQLQKDGKWYFIAEMDMTRPKDEEGAQFQFPPKVDPTKSRSNVNPLTGKEN